MHKIICDCAEGPQSIFNGVCGVCLLPLRGVVHVECGRLIECSSSKFYDNIEHVIDPERSVDVSLSFTRHERWDDDVVNQAFGFDHGLLDEALSHGVSPNLDYYGRPKKSS